MYNDNNDNNDNNDIIYGQTYNFHLISFIIGLLLGMIIMLIIIWITYYTKTFLFTYCSSKAAVCGIDDYFINPGNALAYGEIAGVPNITPADILFTKVVNGVTGMYYDVVAKNNNCVAKQFVRYIPYPQYCEFFDDSGSSAGTFKRDAFNNYRNTTSTIVLPPVTTLKNCNPATSGYSANGTILIEWDKTTN
jgi:hypothetical protein